VAGRLTITAYPKFRADVRIEVMAGLELTGTCSAAYPPKEKTSHPHAHAMASSVPANGLI
jgi:hypothetical protein